MNSDPMATEKFEEGIRKFEEDTNKLGEIVRAKLGSSTTKAWQIFHLMDKRFKDESNSDILVRVHSYQKRMC
jgi:hypothetical protein